MPERQPTDSIHGRRVADNSPKKLPLFVASEYLQIVSKRLWIERGIEIHPLVSLAIDQPDTTRMLHFASVIRARRCSAALDRNGVG